jgi:hypothetical protein
MKKINFITFITQDYVDILKQYFLSTFPYDDTLIINCVNKKGYFRHDSFAKELEKIRTKFIIDQIKINFGNIIFMIDSDVIFSGVDFKNTVIHLLEINDIVFQNNTQWYNFGVFACNCNEKTLSVFEKLLEKLNSDETYFCVTLNSETKDPHDQHIVNDLVREYNLKHDSFPITFFGGHFGTSELPNEWVLYHATNTNTINDKIEILEKIKNGK